MTDRLDRAIIVAATAGLKYQLPENWKPCDADRIFSRRLIADLLDGLDVVRTRHAEELGWNRCLAAIRDSAGIVEGGE